MGSVLGVFPIPVALIALGACGKSASNNDGTAGQANCTANDAVLYGFDSSDEGFVYDPAATDPSRTNISEGSWLAWDGGMGESCGAGRLRLDIAFDSPAQFVDIRVSQALSDFSGRTIRAQVDVSSGYWSGDVSPGGAYLFVETGDLAGLGKGETVSLSPFNVGGWQELRFDLDAPGTSYAGYDPTAVSTIGIRFYNLDAQAFGSPSPAVVFVDQIALE